MRLMQFTTSENRKEHGHVRQWDVVEAESSTLFFIPGPLCLLLLQGPHRCRCSPPVGGKKSAKWNQGFLVFIYGHDQILITHTAQNLIALFFQGSSLITKRLHEATVTAFHSSPVHTYANEYMPAVHRLTLRIHSAY